MNFENVYEIIEFLCLNTCVIEELVAFSATNSIKLKI